MKITGWRPGRTSRCVASSNDGQLLYWDLQAKKQVRAFRGLSGHLEAVALTANDRQAIVAGSDALVHNHDVDTGKKLDSLLGHGPKVDFVVLSPDGSRLLSCGEDKTLRLWEIASKRELFQGQYAEKVRWVASSPDGRGSVSAGYDGSAGLVRTTSINQRTLVCTGSLRLVEPPL